MIRLTEVSIGHVSPIAQNINLHIPKGQVSALLGSNGCGKTTLLKTMLGLIPSFAGKILLDNQPLVTLKKATLAKLVAYVPQAHQSLFDFKVEDVVLMGRTAYLPLYKSPTSLDKDIVYRTLVNLGIQNLVNKNYNALSGGERQLVLIARALAQQARCLIMDEPTSNLDFGNQIKVLEHIEYLAQQGLTILFTTHQPEQAYRYAQHSFLFHRGEIFAEGQSTKILTHQNLADIYQLPLEVILKNLMLLDKCSNQ